VLAAVGLLSAGAIVLGARTGSSDLATAGAAVFALAASVAAIFVAKAWAHEAASTTDAPAASAWQRESALLAALAYAWGAIAMQGAYLTPLTGLKWQHGWQYALAMALLAVGSLAFASMPGSSPPESDGPSPDASLRLAAPLAAAQALIAAGGLAALVVSGKLWSVRADWAANRVFAGLAVAILMIAASYLVAGRRAGHR
jgi:hypothetical protein